MPAIPRGWGYDGQVGGNQRLSIQLVGLDGIAHVLTAINAVIDSAGGSTGGLCQVQVVTPSGVQLASPMYTGAGLGTQTFGWTGELFVPAGNYLLVQFDVANDGLHGQFLEIQGYDV